MALSSLCVALPQSSYARSALMCSVRIGIDTSKSTSTSTSKGISTIPSTKYQPLPLTGVENPTKFLANKAKELAETRIALVGEKRKEKSMNLELVRFGNLSDSQLLDISYERCRDVFVKDKDAHSINTIFGKLLLDEEKLKGVWAIWAWGRRLDEFVDGINGSYVTPEDMVRREQRTVDLFNGRPWDLYDLALADTVSKYSLDIQLFFDLIEGTRWDITGTTFKNFDEKCLYRYYVASSFFLMLLQVCGISSQSKVPLEKVYEWAITYSIALSDVDALRDIAIDANLGRVYFPQDELALAGLTDLDVFNGKVTPEWKDFIGKQITRARMMLDDGEKVINEMASFEGRWWMWTCGLLYRQDLDAIQCKDNNYGLTKWKPVSEGKANRLWAALVGYAKASNFI